MVSDTDGEGYQCEHCGKVFAYKYYKDKHLKYTRCVDQGDRKYPCHLCTRYSCLSLDTSTILLVSILNYVAHYEVMIIGLCVFSVPSECFVSLSISNIRS